MKLLYLKTYYEPESIASPYLGIQTQEAFAREGFKMELFTPTPSRGLDKETINKYRKIRVEHKLNGMLTVRRFPLYAEGKNPILRAFRYFIQCIKLFFIGVFNKNAKDSDIIMVSSTPPIIGPTAAIIKKIRHIPLIYNLQDIFPDSLVGTGLAKKDGILWKIGRIIEDFTYRNADKIIVISEGFKKNIMAKGVPEEKIVVIYNWVDEKAIVPISSQQNTLFEELEIKRDKFNVVYAGNLGYAQNVDIIIEVASSLQEYNDIQFIIFGTGGLELEYKKLVHDLKISNVQFFPIQPYEKVSCVYGIGNVCVVSCKEGLGGSAMPSKTWSIMSSGRAVLANFDEGELKKILESNQCGVFTKAGDKEAFKQAILDLYHDKERCERYGCNGREFILQNLTRAVGTQKYVDVIKNISRTK